MGTSGLDAAPTPDEVREQLKKILNSKGFKNSSQRKDLLRYLVEQTLLGRNLTQEAIRQDVFPAYKEESGIVRVVISDLRNKYLPNYRQAFPNDPVRIDIPAVDPGDFYKATFAYNHNPRALKLYRRGLRRMKVGTVAALNDAAANFARANDIEQNFTSALLGDAEAMFFCALRYAIESDDYISPAVRAVLALIAEKPAVSDMAGLISRAQMSAQRALQCNSEMWQTHIILASIHASHFEWAEAWAAFDKSKALAPVETGKHPFYLACLMASGKGDDAMEVIRNEMHPSIGDSVGNGLFRLFSYVMRHPHLPDRSAAFSGEHWLTLVVRDLEAADKSVARITSHGVYLGDVEYVRDDLSEIWFYLNGMRHLGLVRLKKPFPFFRFDGPSNWHDEEDLTLPEILHAAIEWRYPSPGSFQVALACMALAEMKRYGGIPLQWCVEPPCAALRQGPQARSLMKGCNGFRRYAIDSLHKACDDHDPAMVWLHLWPFLDPLRGEPEFAELLKRMNL